MSIIIFVAAVNSIIAIVQIWMQKSIGLTWLRESHISSAIPGVAKIVFHGEQYIRAYGLFPHPNIFGGFLLMSIILSLLWIKMFHVEHFRTVQKPANMNIPPALSVQSQLNHSIVKFAAKSLWLILAIQSIALILTFSKSAIIGLGIAFAWICVPRGTRRTTQSKSNINHFYQTCTTCDLKASIVPHGTIDANNIAIDCSTWNNSRTRSIILFLLIIISLAIIIRQDFDRNLKQSFDERMLYLDVSRETILANPILGLGIGQFVWEMSKYAPTNLETWQYQPVHNVFLLIWSELGLIGLVIFILFLYNIFQSVNHVVPRETYLPSVTGENVPRETNSIILNTEYYKYIQSIIVGFVFIMLWDHYSIDIQQGEAAMWIIFGLAVGITSASGKKLDS